MFVVPLKFMCSTQCDTPVRPGRSSFDPTLYQHQTDASGAVCISCTRTVSPLSSTTSRTGSIEGRAGTCVAMGRLYEGEASSPEVNCRKNIRISARLHTTTVISCGRVFAMKAYVIGAVASSADFSGGG